MAEPLTKSAKRATDDMAHGALAAIQELLDQGGIPRGTFGDEQVQNLVALYNRRGWALRWIWENYGEFEMPDWVMETMPPEDTQIPGDLSSVLDTNPDLEKT